MAAARSHFEEAARLLAGTAFETIPLGALARIRIQTGDPAGAERDIRRRIEHLTVAGLVQSGEGAFAWLDLALARLAQREWSNAIVHVDTAIGILETVLGSTYPDIALCLQTRACAQIGQLDFDGVAASLDRIRRIEQRQLVECLAVMAASRRASLLERMRNSLALTISAHLDYAPFNAACETAARALLVTRKGLSGETARQRFEALRRRLGAEEQKVLDRYSSILQQLSAQLVEPDPHLSETARANLMIALNEEKEAIERALPPAVLQPHLGAEPTAGEIAARLAPGDAFIDYVFYQSMDPVRQRPIAGDATRYGAYWVAGDGTWGASPIGSGTAIKDLVERFHRAINDEDGEELSNAAVDGDRMLIASLPLNVARASRLCISLDGMLYLLPFAALMREPGATLLQTIITYVDSARDLLAPPPAPPPRERTAVIGDPDYYANVVNLRRERMEDLPGGDAELMALREVLPRARFWTRAEATKQRLMSLHGPIVLHVITHGVLYDRDGVKDLAMAQSAIALAGYNDHDRGIREGALTGLEASLLDLTGCELVTLSACDTGRGRIDVGQGVLGLRRGLQIANACSQLVTLWPVVGETTARFMTHFYRELADSIPREEAMRNAQLAVAKEFDDWPPFWAPFVLFGARGRIDAASL